MIIVEDISMFDEMQNRVDKIQPKMKVKVISFRLYQVQSESDRDKYYDVYCTRDPHGRRIISCDCWPGRLKKICTHATVALKVHIIYSEKYESNKVHIMEDDSYAGEKSNIDKPYLKNTDQKTEKIGNIRI